MVGQSCIDYAVTIRLANEVAVRIEQPFVLVIVRPPVLGPDLVRIRLKTLEQENVRSKRIVAGRDL